jgi:hypothetical protein
VEDRYFTTVYLWCVLPLAVLFLILLVGAARALWATAAASREEGRSFFMLRHLFNSDGAYSAIVNQHASMALLWTYLVLPPVANKQLQALDCIPFSHDGSSYLRVDTGINCDSAEYKSFVSSVGVFIGIYQSMPVIWFALLYRLRHQLNPESASDDERLALFVRDRNVDLSHLRFLFSDYKTNKWWFEVAEMYRRIVFIGVLPLASPVPATRASLGCVLAIMSVAYFREGRPFRVGFTNAIAHVAQFVILVTFYAALSIDTGVMVDFGLQDTGMGIFLVVTNVAIFGLTAFLGWSRYRVDQAKAALKKSKAQRLEDGSSFTAEKFKTTFDAVVQTSVSARVCLYRL